MPYAEECERPFYVEPSVLLKAQIAPSLACASNSINSLVRGGLFIILVCLIASAAYGPTVFIFGVVVIVALYAPSLYATLFGGAAEGFFSLRDLTQRSRGVEGFRSDSPLPTDAELLKPVEASATASPTEVDVIGSRPRETKPTARNPFMNVLLDEIKYNPKRAEAGDVTDPLVKTQLDDFFRVQWNSDPTDVFGRSQSQRQFYTMPSTSIPNDQESFQNWLYKIPGKTCKEGGREACVTYNNSPLVSNWVGS
jgi:hypothetical protein